MSNKESGGRRPATIGVIRAAVIGLIACILSGIAPATRGNQTNDPITVPHNTIFKLELLSSISTANNKKGDQFNCLVVEPSEFKGATVEGKITKLKNAGRAGKKSEIALAFRTITMNGRTGKFDGQITEVYELVGANNSGKADAEGRMKGKSVQKRALKITIPAVVGGIIGGIFGGPKGAAIGAALGAGLGTASVISEKSPNLEFTQGTLIDVKTAGR